MRDKLIELLEEADRTIMGFTINGDLEILADYLLENDVTIRDRGEWIAKPQEFYLGDTEWMCSVCKEEFCPLDMVEKEFFQMMKFCPNCGADMRGE